MTYKENPKTKGSGILCAIPQGNPRCSGHCKDCFCLSGRSYLEPLSNNLPNVPPYDPTKVLRVNDGLDSNDDWINVMMGTAEWRGRRFFNTSQAIPFIEPWVLTINPGEMTDTGFHQLSIIETASLMFVRFRVNTWNTGLAREAVGYYTSMNIPVVLTFMAYFREPIPAADEHNYEERGRTLNVYKCITFDAWKDTMSLFERNPLVYSCSGADNLKCKHCGHCLREFYRVKNQ